MYRCRAAMKVNMKQINNKTKILIVGLGLIGGSYAKALTKKGYKVRAITLDSSDIEYAIDKGFLEDGTTAVTKEYLAWADVIVSAHIYRMAEKIRFDD